MNRDTSNTALPCAIPDDAIDSEAALNALFGAAGEASLRKEVPHLHSTYRQWIERSPFAAVATSGPGGLDVSPRGDPAPLVRIVDDQTLLLPERRGNNRVDGLRNLLHNPQIALLFFIPGVGETLRVNGRAVIRTKPELLASFAMDGALPKCVVEIRVDTVFFQCARAMLRSRLWRHEVRPDGVPTAGAMLAALSSDEVGGPAYDRDLPARQRSTLY
ncbi:MAG: pyridoxamine 5'-phosphate oxidase family protein [Burkholderiales bacterium]|nr:pyridoxamine 5'-phosphate oxidase family protein [Burkholderiales bacterium]